MGFFNWVEGIIHPGGIIGDKTGSEQGTVTNWLKLILNQMGGTNSKTNPFYAVNTDEIGRVQPFTAFGVPIFANEVVELSGKFAKMIPSKWFTRETVGSGFKMELYNASIRLTSGTDVGYTQLVSKYGAVYVPGIGKVAKFSVMFDPNSSDPNNIQEIGYGDDANCACVSMQGGKLHFILKQNNVVIANIPSDQWDIPVTPDNKGHLIYLAWEWMGVGDFFVWYDGRIVHTFHYLGNYTDPSFWSPDARNHFKCENTGSVSKIYSPRLVATAVCRQGDGSIPPVLGFMAANENLINCSGNVWTPILSLSFNSSINGAENVKISRFMNIITGANKTAQFRIIKNGVVGGTATAVETPPSPTVTPNITVSTNNATGSGYSNNQTVSYKVSAGATNWNGLHTETAASPATAATSVGSTKKQISLSWNPITYAAFYRVYRSVNGGPYYLIAEVPCYKQSFVDNATPNISTDVAPSTSNARGDAYMDKIEGGTRTGGQVILIIDDGSSTVSFGDMQTSFINLIAGETITIEANLTANGTARASFAWEGVY